MIITVIKYLFIFAVCFAIFALVMDRHLRSVGGGSPRFENIGGGESLEEGHGRLDVIRWMMARDKNEWIKREVTQVKPADRLYGPEITATFINHATVLIQTEGFNILTDPMYSERASPFQWIGPKRYAAPGVAWDDLPTIDVVLLSHNHYDHLDIDTLKRLRDRFDPLIFVPMGNAAFLSKHGIENVVELGWWETFQPSDTLALQFVPAQHFSARALSDRNRTLWGGYVVMLRSGNMYFAGDTGYGPFADEIAERYPEGFRFGILPIGAYEPQWFMRYVHTSPDDALVLKERLGVRDALAAHFGTFKLADDAQDQPMDRLNFIMEERGSDGGRFEAFPNGGVMTIPADE